MVIIEEESVVINFFISKMVYRYGFDHCQSYLNLLATDTHHLLRAEIHDAARSGFYVLPELTWIGAWCHHPYEMVGSSTIFVVNDKIKFLINR